MPRNLGTLYDVYVVSRKGQRKIQEARHVANLERRRFLEHREARGRQWRGVWRPCAKTPTGLWHSATTIAQCDRLGWTCQSFFHVKKTAHGVHGPVKSYDRADDRRTSHLAKSVD